jgi:hypothetical protein
VSRPWLLLILALVLALVACDRPKVVVVRVSIPGPDSIEAPVAGIGLVALPYDRDSVLRTLEARAPSPRPSTAALDSLFGRFREPFSAYTQATYAAGKLRESLQGLKRRLDSLPRNAPEYRDLYLQFTRQSDALPAAEKQEASTQAALARARAEFLPRTDTLRARIRRWEDSTYEGYDSITRRLSDARRLHPVTDSTGTDGRAHFSLRRGPWWIYARSWDATDPNAEWYWNVPVSGDTVVLNGRTGTRRAKY